METRIELRTERLILRRFRADDVAAALLYRNDVEFSRFLPHISVPFTAEDAKAFVSRNMSEPWGISPTFAVVLDDALIGTVNLELDHGTRSAMLGYAIGRSWWGRGIAAEAARVAIGWGVGTFHLARIWASTDVRHFRSQRVLEKLGLKREAVITGHHKGRHGELIDEVVYGMATA